MIDRRRWTAGGLGLLLPAGAFAAARPLTPPQTEGPFFPPTSVIRAQDADLVRLSAGDAPAVGQVVHLLGTVRAPDGRPLRNALLEIWQCDANGRYLHPSDSGGRPRDPRFQGYGRALADPKGGFRFRTIRPVAYGSGFGRRTPHIHLAASVGGQRRLTTQLYIEGEPLNMRDAVLRGLSPAERQMLVRPFTDGSSLERGAQRVSFDLVVAA